MTNTLNLFNKDLELSLGRDAYCELVMKTNQIRSQSQLLAKTINELTSFSVTEKFLEIIYVPFLGNIMEFSELSSLNKSSELIFKDFSELHYYINYDVYSRLDSFNFDWHWKEGDFDFIAAQPINLYEKLVYNICRISYFELKINQRKDVVSIQPDHELRLLVKNILKENLDIFPYPDILDYLPITLLEGLRHINSVSKYPFAATHWLGQIHNEKYLFYLAYLKERGSRIIGQPHGGVFSQIKTQLGNQMAEMILSDVYHSPMWSLCITTFPNLRASRNLFINLKHLFFNKRKRKLLVITSVFVDDKKNSLNELFYTNNMSTGEWYHRQLKDLKNHFTQFLDFKTHPLQPDLSVEASYLKQMYPNCEFVSGCSVQKLSHQYDGVIHLDAWGTSIIELAGTDIPQYVYLGPELSINKGYEAYLWNNRISSSRKHYSEGAWIQIDNKSIRHSYGASYFYPFQFVSLFKRLPKLRSV